eukprot:CAMPEP_0185764292 /NCGR_PEP_ID=MMETSP1174-20130828/23231_1 /TAXON_ID=35687 /ORGANISM="Dictyocha speculum, Strain CCMP1381" /LENGTH=75 /DNA_ID=CAMNT_0028446767 /DNA_START=178 /DNA_END=402 /DNA_ORIENTATION=-
MMGGGSVEGLWVRGGESGGGEGGFFSSVSVSWISPASVPQPSRKKPEPITSMTSPPPASPELGIRAVTCGHNNVT